MKGASGETGGRVDLSHPNQMPPAWEPLSERNWRVSGLTPLPMSESPERKFSEFLQVHGHRITKDRIALASHIFSHHEHFTPDDLVLDVNQRKMGISRATIYRTLDLLVEAGLLRKLRFGDRDAYEHEYGYPEHDHLYCTQCKKIVEFHNTELVELCERVSRANQFRATSHRFVITGLCDSCFRSKGTKHKLDFV